jgi:hypothetical protein
VSKMQHAQRCDTATGFTEEGPSARKAKRGSK